MAWLFLPESGFFFHLAASGLVSTIDKIFVWPEKMSKAGIIPSPEQSKYGSRHPCDKIASRNLEMSMSKVITTLLKLRKARMLEAPERWVR
jgi:hypothetical protein